MSPQAAALFVFIMELVSAFISVLVGYAASKAYKTSSAKGFLFLYLGFTILSLGILLRAITATYLAIANRIADSVTPSLAHLSYVAGFVFSLTQLIAYGLFIATYAYQFKDQGSAV
jgi:hypothetical protein